MFLMLPINTTTVIRIQRDVRDGGTLLSPISTAGKAPYRLKPELASSEKEGWERRGSRNVSG